MTIRSHSRSETLKAIRQTSTQCVKLIYFDPAQAPASEDAGYGVALIGWSTKKKHAAPAPAVHCTVYSSTAPAVPGWEELPGPELWVLLSS